jgi:hypothetical protein
MPSMSKRVTRRQLAALIGATTGAATALQAQAPQPEADDLTVQREALQKNHDALLNFKIPIETEPAFIFKA